MKWRKLTACLYLKMRMSLSKIRRMLHIVFNALKNKTRTISSAITSSFYRNNYVVSIQLRNPVFPQYITYNSMTSLESI